MTHKSLPSPPIRNPIDHNSWTGPDGWFSRLQVRVSGEQQILWGQLDKTGSSLSEFTDANHSDLQEIGINTHPQIDLHLAKTNLNAHGNNIDATISFDSGSNIMFDTVTGTMIGTSPVERLAFYGSTPSVKPSAITTQQTTITHTAPITADYIIQDLITGGSSFGFVSSDEAQTLLQVIANLQTRLSEVENRLQSMGLLS